MPDELTDAERQIMECWRRGGNPWIELTGKGLRLSATTIRLHERGLIDAEYRITPAGFRALEACELRKPAVE